MSELGSLAREIRHRVADGISDWERQQLRSGGAAPTPQATQVYGDQLLVSAIERIDRDRMAQGMAALTEQAVDDLMESVRSSLFGHGVLDKLLSDPDLENLVANGHDNVTLTKVGGRRVPGPPLATNEAELEQLIRRLAATAGRTERRFDDGHPILDLRLPDGSRLHAIKDVTSRLCVSIRKHRHPRVSLHDLMALGTVDEEIAGFLSAAIRPPSPCSILVAGGTDTGKTTFLRALIAEIPPTERLVVIEDNAELGLERDPQRAAHVVEMEVRQPNLEGNGGIGMDVLGRQALRMRPDRLIVGECRSGDEVRAMLEAMNSGHEGSLTTIHSDSSLSAITKMQTYALTGRDALSMEASAHLIALVMHLVVHLAKLPDGTRTVTSIREITGADGERVQTNEVYSNRGQLRLATATNSGVTPRLRNRFHAGEPVVGATWG